VCRVLHNQLGQLLFCLARVFQRGGCARGLEQRVMRGIDLRRQQWNVQEGDAHRRFGLCGRVLLGEGCAQQRGGAVELRSLVQEQSQMVRADLGEAGVIGVAKRLRLFEVRQGAGIILDLEFCQAKEAESRA
jgi:hypothetical protein